MNLRETLIEKMNSSFGGQEYIDEVYNKIVSLCMEKAGMGLNYTAFRFGIYNEYCQMKYENNIVITKVVERLESEGLTVIKRTDNYLIHIKWEDKQNE